MEEVHIAEKKFKFEELASATRNFLDDCLIGGSNGRVYKGQLDEQVIIYLFFFFYHHVGYDRSLSQECLIGELLRLFRGG